MHQPEVEYQILFIQDQLPISLPLGTVQVVHWEVAVWKLGIEEISYAPAKVVDHIMDLQLLQAHEDHLLAPESRAEHAASEDQVLWRLVATSLEGTGVEPDDLGP